MEHPSPRGSYWCPKKGRVVEPTDPDYNMLDYERWIHGPIERGSDKRDHAA